MTTIYDKYHLNEVINASGKMTALGVSKYVDEAIEAQQFGGQHFFEMDTLSVNVGKYVADLLEAEDAQIVSSAAAGIAQSVAGLIGQGSQYHVHNPYSKRITKREVIVPKGQNVDFGAPIQTMVEVGGGQVVEAGYANKCTPAHIEDQVTEHTAAILYIKSHHSVQKSMLSVEEAVEVAKKYEVPLIVDAAAEQDLKKYTASGSDLVIFSGAKALEGTTSGVVVGKEEYIQWVRLQSSGIGRAMKIGKENILGLAAAIERYLEEGPETGEEMIGRLTPFIEELNKIAYVNAKQVQDIAGREIYRAQVTVDDACHLTGAEVAENLKIGSPSVYIREHQLNNGILEFDIRSVNKEDMSKIIEKLTGIMTVN